MYRVREGVHLILASASPRRQQMLADLGLWFSLAPSDVDETLLPSETAPQAAQRLARLKAQAALAQWPDRAVLAADTLVALPDGRILGKPRDHDQARSMLKMLSGREHLVVSGYCLFWRGQEQCGVAESRVRFRNLMEAEIEAYLASGEPMDKAGAYAVQGLAAAFVEEVHGSFSNVVGLPLARVVELLLRLGVIEALGEGPR
ncbi:MAG: Maf family protein [Desulfarculus sp.]|nr:Maf family protein [Desulfarculus sp.]